MCSTLGFLRKYWLLGLWGILLASTFAFVARAEDCQPKLEMTSSPENKVSFNAEKFFVFPRQQRQQDNDNKGEDNQNNKGPYCDRISQELAGFAVNYVENVLWSFSQNNNGYTQSGSLRSFYAGLQYVLSQYPAFSIRDSFVFMEAFLDSPEGGSQAKPFQLAYQKIYCLGCLGDSVIWSSNKVLELHQKRAIDGFAQKSLSFWHGQITDPSSDQDSPVRIVTSPSFEAKVAQIYRIYGYCLHRDLASQEASGGPVCTSTTVAGASPQTQLTIENDDRMREKESVCLAQIKEALSPERNQSGNLNSVVEDLVNRLRMPPSYFPEAGTQ